MKNTDKGCCFIEYHSDIAECKINRLVKQRYAVWADLVDISYHTESCFDDSDYFLDE